MDMDQNLARENSVIKARARESLLCSENGNYKILVVTL